MIYQISTRKIRKHFRQVDLRSTCFFAQDYGSINRTLDPARRKAVSLGYVCSNRFPENHKYMSLSLLPTGEIRFQVFLRKDVSKKLITGINNNAAVSGKNQGWRPLSVPLACCIVINASKPKIKTIITL